MSDCQISYQAKSAIEVRRHDAPGGPNRQSRTAAEPNFQEVSETRTGPQKNAVEVERKRDCEYGLSAAPAGRRPKTGDFPPIFRIFAAPEWQKNRFAQCHKNVVFAVDSGERPNLYTHPSARRTALYGLTARLRNPHWFSEKGFR